MQLKMERKEWITFFPEENLKRTLNPQESPKKSQKSG
jgi:hypothetical protein